MIGLNQAGQPEQSVLTRRVSSQSKSKSRHEKKFVIKQPFMKNTPPAAKKEISSSWTFFSNHAHVLLCLHRDGDSVLKEVAVEVGITERAVQKIVSELEAGGILSREKVGRRNHYSINAKAKLRHPIESHRSVADLLRFVS